MSFTVNESRNYPQASDAVMTAAKGAIEGLQGKVAKEDGAAGTVIAHMPKTIHGKVLGDRTHMHIHVHAAAGGETTIDVEIFPVNAVGQKLAFGARKGVANTVIGWFWAHLEHRLK